MSLFDFAAENTIYSKRNYSLAGNPSSDNFIKLIVRIVLPPAGSLITAGAGSSYVFNLKPGNEVQITGPFGDFLLKESGRELIYLGGGAGMAPIRSHLSYLFETVNTDQGKSASGMEHVLLTICYTRNTSKRWRQAIPIFPFMFPFPNQNPMTN